MMLSMVLRALVQPLNIACALPFSRFVQAADEAFSDPSSPHVVVEEVVVWMGPCLGAPSIAAEPVGLPAGLPFQ